MSESGATALAEWDLAPPNPLYYATFLLPASRRPAEALLWQHKALLDDIPFSCQDPGVAAAKLAWWQEEFARAADGAGRHPLSQRWKTLDLDARSLANALAAHAASLTRRGRTPASDSAAELRQVADALAPLAAHLASSNATQGAGQGVRHRTNHKADYAAELTENIAQLLCALQLGIEFLRVGEAHAARHPIWPTTLGTDGEAMRGYVAARRMALRAATATLPAALRRRLCALITQARLTDFALAALDDPARDLMQGRPEAGPGTALAIALRSRFLG